MIQEKMIQNQSYKIIIRIKKHKVIKLQKDKVFKIKYKDKIHLNSYLILNKVSNSVIMKMNLITKILRFKVSQNYLIKMNQIFKKDNL